MILISYINARGEEVVLDDTESTCIWELYGREGTEAPSLKYTEILYGDGSSDVVVVNPTPRQVTLYFAFKTTEISYRRELEVIKQKLIQTGSRNSNWGQLKIYVPDLNAYRYLNCAYIGGLDSFTRENPNVTKFALNFRANDPLFYNGFETVYVVEPDASKGYLLMKSDLYMKPLTDPNNDNITANPNSVYMVSAQDETEDNIVLTSQKIYPTIKISGSAKNIRLINVSTERKIEFDASVEVDGMNYILIETKPLHRKVVKVNTVTGVETNILSKLTADSSLDFFLERGTNVIKFRNSESTPDSVCTFEYTEGFLSAE